MGSERPPEDVVSASAHMAAEQAEPGNLCAVLKSLSCNVVGDFQDMIAGNEQKPPKRVSVCLKFA